MAFLRISVVKRRSQAARQVNADEGLEEELKTGEARTAIREWSGKYGQGTNEQWRRGERKVGEASLGKKKTPLSSETKGKA